MAGGAGIAQHRIGEIKLAAAVNVHVRRPEAIRQHGGVAVGRDAIPGQGNQQLIVARREGGQGERAVFIGQQGVGQRAAHGLERDGNLRRARVLRIQMVVVALIHKQLACQAGGVGGGDVAVLLMIARAEGHFSRGGSFRRGGEGRRIIRYQAAGILEGNGEHVYARAQRIEDVLTIVQ